MPADYFGEVVASRYDERYADMADPAVVEPIVGFLADLAGGRAALELGIGTGRIALPLAQRGVRVHGIDLSRAMVAQLRAKEGAEAIGVTIGDFATTRAEGTFSLAYLVFNTIMNLTTQAAQVACFRTVAAQLEAGGCFVIEVGVPDLRRLPPGETFRVFDVSDGHWGIDEFDVANQGLVSHHFEELDGRTERTSMPFRYVWPAELERLAAGALHEREPRARVRVGEARGLSVRRTARAPHARHRCWRASGDASQKSSIFVASCRPRLREIAQSSTGSSPSLRCERGVRGATRTAAPGPTRWMSSPKRIVSVPRVTMYSSSTSSW